MQRRVWIKVFYPSHILLPSVKCFLLKIPSEYFSCSVGCALLSLKAIIRVRVKIKISHFREITFENILPTVSKFRKYTAAFSRN
jgi:hypothetical protein